MSTREVRGPVRILKIYRELCTSRIQFQRGTLYTVPSERTKFSPSFSRSLTGTMPPSVRRGAVTLSIMVPARPNESRAEKTSILNTRKTPAVLVFA